MKRHPILILGLLLASLLGNFVHAQAASTRPTTCDPATPNNAFCITGTAPTKNADGVTPIVAPLTYRLEQKFGSGSFATVATGLTSLKYYAQNLAPGDYVWRWFASCTSVPNVVTCASESAPSNLAPGSVAVPVVTPGAPVIIIAATIRANGPPLYRVVYTVRPRAGEVVFVAPEAMRPVFAAR